MRVAFTTNCSNAHSLIGESIKYRDRQLSNRSAIVTRLPSAPRTTSPLSPCVTALARECSLPDSVFGPVDFSELRRFASVFQVCWSWERLPVGDAWRRVPWDTIEEMRAEVLQFRDFCRGGGGQRNPSRKSRPQSVGCATPIHPARIPGGGRHGRQRVYYGTTFGEILDNSGRVFEISQRIATNQGRICPNPCEIWRVLGELKGLSARGGVSRRGHCSRSLNYFQRTTCECGGGAYRTGGSVPAAVTSAHSRGHVELLGFQTAVSGKLNAEETRR